MSQLKKGNMMEIQDLILADYAAANDRGKFTLVGAGFTKIGAGKFPCIHPLMFLLVRFKITKKNVGKNRIEIRIVGEKGPIFKANCDVNVSNDHKSEEFLPIPIQLNNLKFETAGDYNIEVIVNGVETKSQILELVDTSKKVGK